MYFIILAILTSRKKPRKTAILRYYFGSNLTRHLDRRLSDVDMWDQCCGSISGMGKKNQDPDPGSGAFFTPDSGIGIK